ncbi:MAG TPA: tetratricopeptide repeat protein [Anaerolineales bacterium]
MRRLAPVVVLITVFLLMGVSGCTKTIDDARSAYNKGDYQTAYRIFKSLAERGDAGAQFSLGNMHMMGQGVPKDNAEALKWYRKAADQDHTGAQLNLGFIYLMDQVIPRDYVLAYMWLNIAASNSSDAKERNAAANTRDRIVSKMTPDQIAEAQRLAKEWKPKKEGK